MLQEIRERVTELETMALVARGNQTTLEEDAEDAKAGRFQAEGRVAEARRLVEFVEDAGLEASIVGLERQVTDLRSRLTPKALEKYDKGDED